MKSMRQRPLGNTGIKVSEVGLGCWGIGGPMRRDGTVSGYGQVEDSESVAMLTQAFDSGLNFVDTAPWYGDGRSERLVGRALRGRRDQIIVSSKVGIYLEDEQYTSDYSGDYIMAHYQDSLERLRTDYIDIYVLHSPSTELYQRSGLEALKELKRKGVIRAFGISFPASHEESERFFLPLCEDEQVEIVQLRFNLLSWLPRRSILSKLDSLGIGVICREPFYFGYLTGRFTRDTVFDPASDVRSTWPRERHLSLVEAAQNFGFLRHELNCSESQAALGYCLTPSSVSTVIPGAMTVEEMKDNLGASNLEFQPSWIEQIERVQEEQLGEEL